ncbi:MAG: hypothetical protein LBJ03_01590 [Holosporales bacterium]|jgi:hypothetical protein|nr:hypothetical protein [Holosporales bacterium]
MGKFFERLYLLMEEDLNNVTAKTPIKDVEFALNYLRDIKVKTKSTAGWNDTEFINVPEYFFVFLKKFLILKE